MPSHRTLPASALCLTVLAVWLIALAVAGWASGAVAAGDSYDLPLWIAGHLARAWLNPAARRLGGGYGPASDAQIVEFLSGSSAIAAAERDLAFAEASGADSAAAESELRRRIDGLSALTWPVEERLATELTAGIRAQDLDTTVPAFTGIRFVWPPVAFAYDLPPYVLVQSPRGRIELQDTTLLRSNLPARAADRLTQEAEAQGNSALVVRIGGLAAYPSVVGEDDSYSEALDLLAHEWTHQYLFFHPLGIRYFQARVMTTINETVANMVGKELSAELRARSPLAAAPERFRSSAPPADTSINLDRVLHQLRLDVDTLLSQGNIAEAERRMADTHRFLSSHGYYLPTINQAYFAFYGAYADTPASTSPLGPRLAVLRRQYSSLGAFVHAVQDVRSADDLNRLLRAPESS